MGYERGPTVMKANVADVKKYGLSLEGVWFIRAMHMGYQGVDCRRRFRKEEKSWCDSSTDRHSIDIHPFEDMRHSILVRRRATHLLNSPSPSKGTSHLYTPRQQPPSVVGSVASKATSYRSYQSCTCILLDEPSIQSLVGYESSSRVYSLLAVAYYDYFGAQNNNK